MEEAGEGGEQVGGGLEGFEDVDEAGEALVDEEASPDGGEGRVRAEGFPAIELLPILRQGAADRARQLHHRRLRLPRRP